MSTAEEMAMAVLRGDMASAMALADMLRERAEDGLIPVVPVKRVKLDVDRFHIVAYLPVGEYDMDLQAMDESVQNWIRDGGTLVLQGITRLELYELP